MRSNTAVVLMTAVLLAATGIVLSARHMQRRPRSAVTGLGAMPAQGGARVVGGTGDAATPTPQRMHDASAAIDGHPQEDAPDGADAHVSSQDLRGDVSVRQNMAPDGPTETPPTPSQPCVEEAMEAEDETESIFGRRPDRRSNTTLFRYQPSCRQNASLPHFYIASLSPRVLYFPALLSPEEAATLIELGKELLIPSGVFTPPTDNDDAGSSGNHHHSGGTWHGASKRGDRHKASVVKAHPHHHSDDDHGPVSDAVDAGAKKKKNNKLPKLAHKSRRTLQQLDTSPDDSHGAGNAVRADQPGDTESSVETPEAKEKFARRGRKSGPRTSSGVRLNAKHPVVRRIDRRILDVFGRQFSGAHAERIQLLRYEAGEKYNGHLDSFGGIRGTIYHNKVKKQLKLEQEQEEEGAVGHNRRPKRGPFVTLDRAVTILMYLSTVEDGGNTSLPFVPDSASAITTNPEAVQADVMAAGIQARGHTHFRPGLDDPCDAERFFSIRPAVGAAIAFYSLKPSGAEDKQALHMGCPVLKGTKYVATKWLHVPLPWPEDHHHSAQRSHHHNNHHRHDD